MDIIFVFFIKWQRLEQRLCKQRAILKDRRHLKRDITRCVLGEKAVNVCLCLAASSVSHLRSGVLSSDLRMCPRGPGPRPHLTQLDPGSDSTPSMPGIQRLSQSDLKAMNTTYNCILNHSIYFKLKCYYIR